MTNKNKIIRIRIISIFMRDGIAGLKILSTFKSGLTRLKKPGFVFLITKTKFFLDPGNGIFTAWIFLLVNPEKLTTHSVFNDLIPICFLV